MTQDAGRFPELARQYQKDIARGRTGIRVAFLRNVARKKCWAQRDPTQDAALYEALLRAGIYEEALHGLLPITPDAIDRHARPSAKTMWNQLTKSY